MTLVDSNVLLDLITDDRRWAPWSLAELDAAGSRGPLMINPIVYAEIAGQFASRASLDEFVREGRLVMTSFSLDVLFQAGSTRRRYRQNGGAKARILPDFLIGAQAMVEGWRLLTRDVRTYGTYFPTVELITPSSNTPGSDPTS